MPDLATMPVLSPIERLRGGVARTAWRWERDPERRPRYARRLLSPRPAEVELDLFGGLTYRLMLADEDQWRAYMAGRSGPTLRPVLERLVTEGATFLDVGANVGLYSLLAASLVGRDGRVIAFEPNPVTYAYLERNLSLNPDLADHVSLVPSAVGESQGQVQFFATQVNSGWSSRQPLEDGASNTLVDMVRLDDAVPGAVDVIKIDVEGFELGVLQGFSAHLTSDQPPLVVFEQSDLMAQAGFEPGACAELLEERGYELFELAAQGPRPFALSDQPMNVLAIPTPRTDAVLESLAGVTLTGAWWG